MSEAVTVLVVDDEPALARALEINLRARGYRPLTAASGSAALRAVTEQHVDAIILDLGLPDMDGQDVIAGLRGWNDVPVIVLSARHTSDDRIDALDAGADDYVTKPFDMGELLARLRAALRRGARAAAATPVLHGDGLTLDLPGRVAERDGQRIRLTPTEWRLLDVLARTPGVLVPQATLLREVWGPGYEDQHHYLRVYVATLRRKLERDPGRPVLLLTEPGLGYRLDAR